MDTTEYGGLPRSFGRFMLNLPQNDLERLSSKVVNFTRGFLEFNPLEDKLSMVRRTNVYIGMFMSKSGRDIHRDLGTGNEAHPGQLRHTH